jgi:hypothetical protein
MSEKLKLELEQREKTRKVIARAERAYVRDFEFLGVVPVFTEDSANDYLQAREAFKLRWARLAFPNAA